MSCIEDMYIDTIKECGYGIYGKDEWQVVVLLNDGTEERAKFYRGMNLQDCIIEFYNLLGKILDYV